MEKICQKSTDREIRAQDAERASMKLKQVEYMERHLGDIFEGIISRIVKFGLFVEGDSAGWFACFFGLFCSHRGIIQFISN